MASYALDPNGLLDTGEELRGVTNTIQRSVDELNTDVSKFIEANTGSARDAFVKAQQDWQAGIQEMQRALTVGIQRLNDIHDTYRLGDAHGAALSSRTTSS
jgi:WXG100 family type VII secretion target